MKIRERKKIGQRAVSVAISGNILLTIFNFIVGLMSGSTALIAEAAHTLSDILTSIITFVGFKIGLKPPDEYHHYGYGRAEPIVGLIIVVFLLYIAYEIFSEVYSKLVVSQQLTPPDSIAAVMALIGIVVNYAMTTYLMKSGKKINSPAIIADAHHQRIDIFSCGAIFIGVIGSRMGMPILDPLVAVLIGLLVLKTAFKIGRENISNIMGKVPSTEILNDIKDAALSIKGVQGIHDLKVNYMGPYASVELHVDAMGDLTLREAHDIAHQVEENIIEKVEVVAMVGVHVCPADEHGEFCLD